MSERKDHTIGLTDEIGRDVELGQSLELLDPSQSDPNYWLRFREWVVRSAATELARRRLMAELTVGDVMSSWARTVLPTAVLAAALAGLMLLRTPSPAPQLVDVEELLVSEVEGETIPVTLGAEDADPNAVAFASEIF